METLRFLLTTTFYPPYHVGGDAVAVLHQAELLASKGHEVHVAFSPAAHHLKMGGRERKEVPTESNGVMLHPLWRGTLDPLWAYLTGRTPHPERLELLARTISPDVVHHHNISLLGLDVLHIRAERRLYTAHDPWLVCPKSSLFRHGGACERRELCWLCTLLAARPPQLWRHSPRLHRAVESLDCIIAPSRFYAHLLEGWCESVHHIPNFCPPARPPPDAHTKPEPYMLYAGVLEGHKGILQLAEQLPPRFPYRLVIAGRGSLSTRLARLARHTPNVDYVGWVEQEMLDRLRAQASFVVLPSVWYENCPMAVIEAYASGVPVLVSDMGGLPEMVDEGKSGFVLKASLEDVLPAIEDADLHSLKRGALEMYESTYSPQAFLREYMKVV